MPERQPTHPTREQLAAFLHGQLSGHEQRAVETHVTGCDTCCDELRRVPHDELVERLRSSASSMSIEPAAVKPSAPSQPGLAPAAEIPSPLADHSRYRVIKMLGKGGMGVVYQAEHRLMGRTVALKVINQRLLTNEIAVERFRQEVKSAARLIHRNIVTAFDAEQAGDLHFLVMEFVEGTDLATTVAQRGRLPVLYASNYVMQVAQGLQHAHDQGMVHRDIKPQNLMRTKKGVIKILDFGLARLASADAKLDQAGLTAEGVALGTPDYIAPEQARDARRADIRADIYSLGCTLYYLLTAKLPFPSGTAVEKVLSHCTTEPISPAKLRDDIPEELVRIVERMMAKDPEARFQTPAEVVTALKPFGQQGAAPAETKADGALGGTLAVGFQAIAPDMPFQFRDDPKPLPNRRRPSWREQWSRFRLPLLGGAVTVAAVCLIPMLLPSGSGGGKGRNVTAKKVTGTSNSKGAASTDRTGAWVDLVPQIDPLLHGMKGQWQVSGHEVSVEAVEAARLALLYTPPAEYDFEIQFTRHTGIHSIAMIFTMNGLRATFELDAWGQHLAGIQSIGGIDARGNATRVEDQALTNGRRYNALLKVRRGRVEAYLDGKLVTTYHGDGSDLSLPSVWWMPPGTRLGVGAFNSETTFHQIRVRPAQD